MKLVIECKNKVVDLHCFATLFTSWVHHWFSEGFVLLKLLIFCVVFLWLFFLSSYCVFYAQCCQCLWMIHSWLTLRFSLTFIRMETLPSSVVCLFSAWLSIYLKISSNPDYQSFQCIFLIKQICYIRTFLI